MSKTVECEKCGCQCTPGKNATESGRGKYICDACSGITRAPNGFILTGNYERYPASR